AAVGVGLALCGALGGAGRLALRRTLHLRLARRFPRGVPLGLALGRALGPLCAVGGGGLLPGGLAGHVAGRLVRLALPPRLVLLLPLGLPPLELDPLLLG